MQKSYLWHPCMEMEGRNFKPMQVVAGQAEYLILANGKKIIDAISSWWCKSLGHNHPQLQQALITQMQKFEHVIFTNTTNPVIEQLAEKLATITGLAKVFFAGDGSSAVEIAMKMSIHLRMLQGNTQRHKFVVLKNSYHGETMGALSLSAIGKYKTAYEKLLFTPIVLQDIPYVINSMDPLWEDASIHWEKTVKILQTNAKDITAIIVEPLIQGAAGMKIYSKDFLLRLRKWATENQVHFIADEIMTGIGRCGKMLACEYAGIVPDILCLGKGLTSGWLAFSAVLVSADIYAIFANNTKVEKSFIHSHTYSGNALAAAVALETLNILEQQQLCFQANEIGGWMQEFMLNIAVSTKKLVNVRQLGAIVAADLIDTDNITRIDLKIAERALEFGALLRPIGKTIYWVPPLNVECKTLENLQAITQQAIEAVCNERT